jgi:hypothetical protein
VEDSDLEKGCMSRWREMVIRARGRKSCPREAGRRDSTGYRGRTIGESAMRHEGAVRRSSFSSTAVKPPEFNTLEPPKPPKPPKSRVGD